MEADQYNEFKGFWSGLSIQYSQVTLIDVTVCLLAVDVLLLLAGQMRFKREKLL
jgi:hypothetical protein